MKPQYFSEFLLRVYTKKVEFAEVIQEGYRAILTRLQKMGEPLLDDVDAAAREGSGPTPPVTEAPTTPKASSSALLHSRSPSFTKPTSPFAKNKFTEFPKNRSVSPARVGPPESEVGLLPNPPLTPVKRKRLVEEGSKAKKKKK
jgi:hypothetical protein